MSEWKKENITGIAHLYHETDEKGKTRAECGHLSYTRIVEVMNRLERTIWCTACLRIEEPIKKS